MKVKPCEPSNVSIIPLKYSTNALSSLGACKTRSNFTGPSYHARPCMAAIAPFLRAAKSEYLGCLTLRIEKLRSLIGG